MIKKIKTKVNFYKSQPSLTTTQCCVIPIMFQTKVDAQCDKLDTVVR